MKQPKIESLSITTDCTCYESVDDVELGLTTLTKLKRLRWRAPDCADIHTLSDMIHTNAKTLKYLEVDLVNWERIGYYCSRNPYDDGPRGLEHWIRLWRVPEGKFWGSKHTALQTLCLTEVALSRESVGVLDFGVLRTLRLRNCERWDSFLEHAVGLHLPIGLKTLEVTVKPGLLSCDADEVLSRFLKAFDGLEELYVGIESPLPFNELWPGVIAHHATLKRFVHHQRTGEGFHPHLTQEVDADLLLDPGDAFLQTFDRFQLEAMGLSINPEDLVSALKADWYWW